MPAANQQRLVNAVLTDIAQGYKNAEFIGLMCCPIVYSAKDVAVYAKFGKESFRVPSTLRSQGGKSNRMTYEVGNGEVALREHDMEIPVDDAEREEATAPIDPELRAPELAMDVIALKHEKECAETCFDYAAYAADHKVTLGGGTEWTDPASDPIGAIKDAKEVVRTAIGRYPNAMILGAKTYKALQEHPKILERIKYSQKAIITAELIAEVLELDMVMVGKAVYQDDAGVQQDVWGKHAVLCYCPKSPGIRVPAHCYTVRKRGYPMTDEYRENQSKSDIYRTTDKFRVVLVGPDAGYMFKDAA